MKILHVLSQRPEATGSGIFIQAMLREAARKGYSNFLVAGIPDDQPPDPELLSDAQYRFVRFQTESLPFKVVGMSDVMPYDSTRFCDMDAQMIASYERAFEEVLSEVVPEFRPDIIHCNHLWLVAALVWRLCPEIPMVSMCHGSDLRQFQNCPHLAERVQRPCAALDAILALSSEQKDQIDKLYEVDPDKVRIVGAGYNEALFTPATKSKAPVTLAYAGKLSRAKGVPWFLKALDGIQNEDWHLHLVGGGSGPEKAECLELAALLGNEKITMHDPMPQAALADIIKQAHVFVLPSLYEGLPLVLLEALACGCRLEPPIFPACRSCWAGFHMNGLNGWICHAWKRLILRWLRMKLCLSRTCKGLWRHRLKELPRFRSLIWNLCGRCWKLLRGKGCLKKWKKFMTVALPEQFNSIQSYPIFLNFPIKVVRSFSFA